MSDCIVVRHRQNEARECLEKCERFKPRHLPDVIRNIAKGFNLTPEQAREVVEQHQEKERPGNV